MLSVCPAGVTDGGAYDRLSKEYAANGNHPRCVSSCLGASLHPWHVSAQVVPPARRRPLSWLYEVSLAGVVRSVVAQVRWGAPAALVPLTLLPVRLLGALQQLAPDWVTAVMQSPRIPGNPLRFAEARGADDFQPGAEVKKDAAALAAAALKEE